MATRMVAIRQSRIGPAREARSQRSPATHIITGSNNRTRTRFPGMRIWDFKARTIASPRSAIMANVSGLTSTKRPEEIDIEDRRLDPPELLAGRLLDPTRIDQQLYTPGRPVAAPFEY